MTTVTVVPGGRSNDMPVAAAALTTSIPATGNAIPKASTYSTYQVITTATATVVIEATNEGLMDQGSSTWVTLGTITLAAPGSDGFATASNWRWVRARVTACTGPTNVVQGI